MNRARSVAVLRESVSTSPARRRASLLSATWNDRRRRDPGFAPNKSNSL